MNILKNALRSRYLVSGPILLILLTTVACNRGNVQAARRRCRRRW